MAAHGGLAFGKDSGQKVHSMQQAAKKQQKMQQKVQLKAQHQGKHRSKRKRSADALPEPQANSGASQLV